MAMLTLDTASEANISKTLTFRNRNNLREASFSSYLNGADETFVLQLAESSKNCKSLISTPFEQLHLGSKKAEDNEIDIFSADKYFNGGVDEETPRMAKKCSPKLDQKMDPPPELVPVKQQTRSGTPSIISESSSNSQSVLLRNVPRDQQPHKTNKVNRRSFLASLGCNCSCSDKNSVDIDVPIGESSSNRRVNGKPRKTTKAVDLVSLSESQSSPWIRGDSHCGKFDQVGYGLGTEGHFRFPASNSKPGDSALELLPKAEEDDTRRKSLEVFGSPTQRKGKNSLSLERSLNMLAWDALVPKVEEIEIPASSGGVYNDTDSEASSDLFEIESFSTNPGQHLTRQASDGMSSSITQTCYAPSEASIDWSIVTASAADFSVMSDSEELRSTSRNANQRTMSVNGRTTPGREMPKIRSSILSGCYSQKAVRVAGDVHRTSEKTSPGRHQRLEFQTPMTRFHDEDELARFDKRNRHFIHDTRLLTCSQSGRATDLYKH